MDLPVVPPVKPMLAKAVDGIPEIGDLAFEPKWDGFRCIVYRDGDRLELVSRNLKPLARYFPELADPLLAALPERCVIDGEIVVADAGGNGLDFDALLQRIHPAKSRIERLAVETAASFVAFDVLALGDNALLGRPMSERRKLLVDAIEPNGTVVLTPASTDRSVADEWFSTFEGAGLDGIIAKPLDGPYNEGKRSLVKVKHQRTALCAVPGYRVHKDGNGVGSLLLGLYDASGDMHSVGVAASFSVARRTELLDELEPRTHDALVDHPWQGWATHQADGRADGRAGGQADGQDERLDQDGKAATVSTQGGSRWNAGKDLSFVPIRMGLVAEVTFGQLEGGRFRHGVSFVRWCPDGDPAACRYDQLDVAAPVDFHEFLRVSTSADL
jgi:ATP-dependent DNA ligase